MFIEGKVTIDRSEIQAWVKARQGWPALIYSEASAGLEMALSIVFPDCETGEIIRTLSWDEFFEKFDQLRLAFVYQDVDGSHSLSRSYAFV